MNAQVKPNTDGLIVFTSDYQLPVQVLEQKGEFYPKDKKTGQVSTDLLYKVEAEIHDPSKVHPVLYPIYRTQESKLENGHYLATITMAYLDSEGKYLSRLEYKKTDEKTFKETSLSNRKEKKQNWDTKLLVEVYGNEPAGSGFNHEAYILDTVRNRPVLVETWQSEQLKEGVYKLEIAIERRKGKLITRHHYVFKKPHKVHSS